MVKSISILNADYKKWVKELSLRYRSSQIKAAVKVNQELIRFYWSLGKDIVEMQVEKLWGSSVIKNLSVDIQREMPELQGFSKTNLYYIKKFYILYKSVFEKVPQPVEQLDKENNEIKVPQVVGDLDNTMEQLLSVPWGHHRLIIDKIKDNPQKALFFVNQVVQNGWSRSMLLNWIDSDLYERQGKALSNFSKILPDTMSDLAQELTKDPYNFDFTGVTSPYNERILKDALLNNITRFLTELGTGFAYVGKEYRLQIGETENFIDLLFYNLTLSCYVVIEVKIGKFAFADTGQLGGYVVACNHILRKEGRDNPTIGLLICKEKDKIQAQYALESSSQPIAISEFDLEKFYPEKIEGTIPTIAEIEAKLSENESKD